MRKDVGEDDYKPGKAIPYKPKYEEKRKKIFKLLEQGKNIKAVKSVSNLIKRNTTDLLDHFSKNEVINFSKIQTEKLVKISRNNIDESVNSFLYIKEYLTNILLSIHIYTKINSRDKITRTLNYLTSEMKTYKFSEFTMILISHIIQNNKNNELINNTTNLNNNKSGGKPERRTMVKSNRDLDELYFSSLKLYICCVQYASNLREFNLYEDYILEFMKIVQARYSTDYYILCNAFLLLGNLYVKSGLITKAYYLFERIIDICPKDENVRDVLISAYYNCGLIDYTIGKYEDAKKKLENALEIKKSMNEITDRESIQVKIYETLAEFDVQYKNYSSAYKNIQKGADILNNNNILFGNVEQGRQLANLRKDNKRLRDSNTKLNNATKDLNTNNNITSNLKKHQQINISNPNIINNPDNNTNHNTNHNTNNVNNQESYIITELEDIKKNLDNIKNLEGDEKLLQEKLSTLCEFVSFTLSNMLKLNNICDNNDSINKNEKHFFEKLSSYYFYKKGKNGDAEDNPLIMDFANGNNEGETIKHEREINERELRNFFLFISSLSEKQINKLNDDQDRDCELTKKYPIIFSKDFKNSLNAEQRFNFCQLKLTSLTRIKTLEDYTKKISVKNLNYKALYRKQTRSEIDKINLKDWNKEPESENKQEDIIDEVESKQETNGEREKQKETVEINGDDENKGDNKTDSKVKKHSDGLDDNKQKLNITEVNQLIKEIFIEGSECIYFDKFKEFILNYFLERHKDKIKHITDQFIIIMTEELNKAKIKKILFNPELAYDLLMIYINNERRVINDSK